MNDFITLTLVSNQREVIVFTSHIVCITNNSNGNVVVTTRESLIVIESPEQIIAMLK